MCMSQNGSHTFPDLIILLKRAVNNKYLLPVLVFCISFLWKLPFITHRDLCIDEPFTLFNAQKSVADIIRLTADGEPNPPLFLLMLHFWIKLSGIGVAAVRILPLIFNSLGAGVIFLTGRKFFGVWTALVASGLFLVSNFQFFHAIELRTYSLLTLATAASLYFYLSVLKEPRKICLVTGLVLSDIALVYTHHFGWLVLLMQFVNLLFELKNRKAANSVLIAGSITVIAYLPFFIILFRQFVKSSKGTWIQPPDSGLQYFYQIYQLLNHKEVVNAILWILASGIIYTIYHKKWKSVNRDLLIVFVWWFVPFTLMFFVSFKIPVFITRYLLFNSVGLYLFSAAASIELLHHNKYLTPLAAAILIGMMANRMRILPDDFSYRELRNSTAFVTSNQRKGDIVILYPYWTDTGFAYYTSKQIFRDTRYFTRRLNQRLIFPVWGIEMVKSIIEQQHPTGIIYCLNGPEKGGDDGIGTYLISHYKAVDSAFFPQTIAVTVLKSQSGN